jgi:hypothetical protein
MNISWRTIIWQQFGAAIDMLGNALRACPDHLYVQEHASQLNLHLGQKVGSVEYSQLDPLQVIARSHDITLHSRVLDTTPGMWEEVAYEQRKFFEWGGWLATRPMDELPYWRAVMRREREGAPNCDARIRRMGREHAEAIDGIRTTNTFVILGFWLEDEALGKDEALAEALARGFARFVPFLGASKLDAEAIHEPLLRRRAGSWWAFPGGGGRPGQKWA